MEVFKKFYQIAISKMIFVKTSILIIEEIISMNNPTFLEVIAIF